MRRTPRRASGRLRGLVLAALALGVPGCGLFSAFREDPLEGVAKDWMRVIRASQVIPIYPLTEDLQPGDVFLVQTPVERQQELWQEEKGYLPLDYHVARLDPAGYAAFYDHSFVRPPAMPRLPRDWRDPSAPTVEVRRAEEDDAHATANGGGSGAPVDARPSPSWTTAPGASFPSYTFSVDRAGGFNLAVPVQSVPIGLSLMGGEAVEGSLSLGRARTLGIDITSLYAELLRWGDGERAFLASFAPAPGEAPHDYLRVVTRIYLVGKIDVAMRTSQASSGGLDVGAPKPVDLVLPETGEDAPAITAQEYEENLAALNRMLEDPDRIAQLGGQATLLPGGSVRITAASARSISLSEEFDPPLVVGYLGFDVPILAQGELGLPIPTRSLLEGHVAPTVHRLDRGDAVQAIHADAVIQDSYGVLAARTDDPRAATHVAALDALTTDVPREGLFFARRSAGLTESRVALDPEVVGMPALKEHLGVLSASVNALESALGSGTPFDYVDASGATRHVAPGTSEHEALAARLSEQRTALERTTAAYLRAGRGAVGYLATLIGG